ncbi:MAG: flagellar biosynthetic protein FliO [Candidatus Gastranaerophilales bacterium]|nr:flagellar biosynthetic protein FliO [Candidatus Gastranaerophilales bacterium]
MMKKTFFCMVILAVMICFSGAVLAQEARPVMQPLKLEHKNKKDYQYGDFKKNYKPVSNTEAKGDFSNEAQYPAKKEKSVLDIFVSLTFVVLLILVTAWVYIQFKRINPQSLLSGKFSKLDEDTFKIISSMQLGAGKSIYLIEINDKRLIVGTTPSSVNLLSEMEKKDENKAMTDECIEKIFKDKAMDFEQLDQEVKE